MLRRLADAQEAHRNMKMSLTPLPQWILRRLNKPWIDNERRMNVKIPSRNATVILTAALGVGMLVNTPQPAAAQDEDSQGQVCSLETIEGSYGWTTTGWIVSAGPVGPVADVGVISFGGNGGATQTSTVSLSGSVQRRSSLSGSYKVNPDCTGSITMVFQGPAGPLEFHDNLVIVNHGRELRTIVSDNGRVLAGTAIRQ